MGDLVMTFHEAAIFPDWIDYGSSGAVNADTLFRKFDNKTALSKSVRLSHRRQYFVKKATLDYSDLLTLKKFFIAREASLYGFRLLDKNFCSTADDGFSEPNYDEYTGDWVGSTDYITNVLCYPLKLSLNSAYYSGQTFYVTKPIFGTIQIKDSFVGLLTEGTDYTINYSAGYVIFHTLPSAFGFTWAGKFHIPVRFSTETGRNLSLDLDNPTLGAFKISMEELPTTVNEYSMVCCRGNHPYGGGISDSFGLDEYVLRKNSRVFELVSNNSGDIAEYPIPSDSERGGVFQFVKNNSSSTYNFTIRSSDDQFSRTLTIGEALMIFYRGVGGWGVDYWYDQV